MEAVLKLQIAIIQLTLVTSKQLHSNVQITSTNIQQYCTVQDHFMNKLLFIQLKGT